MNSPLAEERGRFDGLAMPAFAAWTEKVTWRNASYVLPVTAVVGGYVERAGVPASRIVVTSNGVNEEEFRAVPQSRRPALPAQFGSGPVLGFVGYVRAWHGLPQIVDLLAKDSDFAGANLMVVGDGPGRADLEARAKELGVADRLWVTGLVAREALAAPISCFDVALQPEVTGYASPLKLFEYMALNRANVAPDAPKIREVLEHGQDSLLFEPESPKSLGDAIRLLVRDAELRARLGAGAADKIRREDISWARNARRAMALVEAARSKGQKS